MILNLAQKPHLPITPDRAEFLRAKFSEWAGTPDNHCTLPQVRRQAGEAFLMSGHDLLQAALAAMPVLKREQPCGCVLCTCHIAEDEENRCKGCGGKHCGTHDAGDRSGFVYEPMHDHPWMVRAVNAERANAMLIDEVSNIRRVIRGMGVSQAALEQLLGHVLKNNPQDYVHKDDVRHIADGFDPGPDSALAFTQMREALMELSEPGRETPHWWEQVMNRLSRENDVLQSICWLIMPALIAGNSLGDTETQKAIDLWNEVRKGGGVKP